MLWLVHWVYGTVDKLLNLSQEVWGVFNARLMLLLGGSLLLRNLMLRTAGGGYQLLNPLDEVQVRVRGLDTVRHVGIDVKVNEILLPAGERDRGTQ